MNDAVLLGLIVGTPAIIAAISPFASVWLNNRNDRARRSEDYKRQDDVADRLLARQDLMTSQATEAARLLKENNHVVAAAAAAAAESAAATLGQVKATHTLVNSTHTALLQSYFDALTLNLSLMVDMVAIRRAEGSQPSVDALAQIEATREKIATLHATIEERLVATKRVEESGVLAGSTPVKIKVGAQEISGAIVKGGEQT